MLGCLRRLGCLVVLLLLAGAAWLFRDQWYPKLFGTPAPVESVAEGEWDSVTPAAAQEGKSRIAVLGTKPTVPDSVVLTPSEAVSIVLDTLLRQLPGANHETEATIIGDRLYVRANVALDDVGRELLGPLGGMLDARETVLLGGTLTTIEPGVGQFRVAEVKVRDFSLPTRLLPKVMQELRRNAPRPEGISDDALSFDLPEGVREVKIQDGHVVLHRGAAR